MVPIKMKLEKILICVYIHHTALASWPPETHVVNLHIEQFARVHLHTFM